MSTDPRGGVVARAETSCSIVATTVLLDCGEKGGIGGGDRIAGDRGGEAGSGDETSGTASLRGVSIDSAR
eukprot:552388-Prymnesium_polylepis.2